MPTQQAHDNTWFDSVLLLVTATVIWARAVLGYGNTR